MFRDILEARDGKLFVNDELSEEPFVIHKMHYSFPKIIVPIDMYFVLGDNRNDSFDSHIWGFLPKKNILGRAMFVWLSCEETIPYAPFLCNPMTLRWGRFFHQVN